MTSSLRRLKIESKTGAMTDAITATEQAFEAAGKPLAYSIISGHGGINTYDIIYDVADSALAAGVVAAMATPENFAVVDGHLNSVVPDTDDPGIVKSVADTARATQVTADAATQAEYNERDLPAIKTAIKAHKLNTQTDTEVDALEYSTAIITLENLQTQLTAIYDYLIARGTAVNDTSIAAAKLLTMTALRQGIPRRKPPATNIIPPQEAPPADDADDADDGNGGSA